MLVNRGQLDKHRPSQDRSAYLASNSSSAYCSRGKSFLTNVHRWKGTCVIATRGLLDPVICLLEETQFLLVSFALITLPSKTL